jgi:hypothetical protein
VSFENEYSDASVQVVAAMLESAEHLIPTSFTDFYNEVRARFRAERERRGFAHATVDNSIEPTPVQQYLLDDELFASDQTVLFWHALGAEIADFSCLGRGVRDHVHAVWQQSQAELKRRGIERTFFCDME